MSDLREYKCPACGGAIEFDSKSQKMKCPYCDTEFELETLKELDEQMEREAGQQDDLSGWQTDAGGEWQEGETDGMNVYTCQSCGGEIIADENTGASNCPYCGNPVIMTEKFKGALRPDLVIPFKLDKKAAKEAYYRHIKGRTFLPKAFRRENHINEIKGLYVPFWLFDGDVDADVRYKATKVRMWSDHDYDYTETSYYSVERSGEMTFVSVPVDGSEKMADDLMESIEPFKISESVDFQNAYLSGYLADKYDVSEKESINRAGLNTFGTANTHIFINKSNHFFRFSDIIHCWDINAHDFGNFYYRRTTTWHAFCDNVTISNCFSIRLTARIAALPTLALR